MTVKELADVIDLNRESEEKIRFMDHNGQAEAEIMICSKLLDGVEDRVINSLQAVDEGIIAVWLEDEK